MPPLGIKNNGMMVQEYVYDFDVDGGLISTISLSGKSGKKPLPVGAVVHAVTAQVLTACTSGGSATLAYGNTDDPDGYSGVGIAVASLTANALFNGWDNAAALIWDDTNDHPISLAVVDADSGVVSVTIATAALTAGVVVIMVQFTFPGAPA